MIEDFLDKFVFISEGSTSKEQIDLNLALKSLPLKVEVSNIYRIDLLNFNLIQKSLIAFQNDDQDELINFYDNRNKARLRKITKKAGENENQTEEIKGLAQLCMASLTKLMVVVGGVANMPDLERQGKKGGEFSKVAPI